jgi:hypothetical protein
MLRDVHDAGVRLIWQSGVRMMGDGRSKSSPSERELMVMVPKCDGRLCVLSGAAIATAVRFGGEPSCISQAPEFRGRARDHQASFTNFCFSPTRDDCHHILALTFSTLYIVLRSQIGQHVQLSWYVHNFFGANTANARRCTRLQCSSWLWRSAGHGTAWNG